MMNPLKENTWRPRGEDLIQGRKLGKPYPGVKNGKGVPIEREQHKKRSGGESYEWLSTSNDRESDGEVSRADNEGPFVSGGGARALSAGLQRPKGGLKQEGREYM